MHWLMAAGTIVWFFLVGLLWYLRPGDLVWFAGTMLLGIVYFVGFFCYVTRAR
jgi:hypothetical protein